MSFQERSTTVLVSLSQQSARMLLRFYPRTKVLATPRLRQVIHLSPSSSFSTTRKKLSATMPIPARTASTYSFPKHRLKITQNDATKIPVVLIACGSYSPVTILHLQMFEMASDFTKFNTNFEMMGGYMSPVSDTYKKSGLINSTHRIRMCELAVDEKPDTFLMVDPWEALQPEYTPTAQVLDHFHSEINEVLGGARKPNGAQVPMKIMLLAGGDLMQTMSTLGVWSKEDLERILGDYGALVVTRKGTDINDALESLQRWKNNIYVIEANTINDVSSTKIRLAVKKKLSIKYLTPEPVIEYIEKHYLYQQEREPSVETKDEWNRV